MRNPQPRLVDLRRRRRGAGRGRASAAPAAARPPRSRPKRASTASRRSRSSRGASVGLERRRPRSGSAADPDSPRAPSRRAWRRQRPRLPGTASSSASARADRRLAVAEVRAEPDVGAGHAGEPSYPGADSWVAACSSSALLALALRHGRPRAAAAQRDRPARAAGVVAHRRRRRPGRRARPRACRSRSSTAAPTRRTRSSWDARTTTFLQRPDDVRRATSTTAPMVASVAAAPENGVGIVGIYPHGRAAALRREPGSAGITDSAAIDGHPRGRAALPGRHQPQLREHPAATR